MQQQGTLTEWQGDRGLITPYRGKEEIFVHVSAFPADGPPPQLNEPLLYEIATDSSGRRRAVNISRPEPGPPPGNRSGLPKSLTPFLASLGLFIAVGVYGYLGLYSNSEPASTTQSRPAGESFTCDGRSQCTEMHSCAEARYFLSHCPNTAVMDPDRDGIPCAERLCSAEAGR